MRSPDRPQSTTSLPRAPRDDEAGRTRRYLVTMAIRTGCFVLALVVHPYGWWTWVFLVAAIFLPYFAVVMANVGSDARAEKARSPERMLPAAPSEAGSAAPARPVVIRLSESPAAHPPGLPPEQAPSHGQPPAAPSEQSEQHPARSSGDGTAA